MLPRTSLPFHRLLAILCLTSGLGASIRADLVLETETAELGKKGDMLFSTGVQIEKEKDGSRTIFTLNQFEYAVTDRAEILIEPFFQEWDQPKGEQSFHGMGDLEITPSYMVLLEKPYVPAIVLAFKLKVPTARNLNIGTRKFDYLPYLIFGKTIGDWVFNANFGYNFITSPSRDEPLKNQFIYDFSAEYKITPKWSVFGEVFANSSPAVGERGTFSGAVATEYKITDHFNAFVSVGYDSDELMNIRPGFNIEF
ncbi:MAG: putative MetA-pathway of phenol degradation [Chthoniobacter sp.]|jgi:hypothetical protein|nr:putative MetA-pathway of phenol degradation [Chthoniobacter sp.]